MEYRRVAFWDHYYYLFHTSESNVQTFVDATSKKNISEIINILNKELILTSEWMDGNQLKVNIRKTKCITVFNKSHWRIWEDVGLVVNIVIVEEIQIVTQINYYKSKKLRGLDN